MPKASEPIKMTNRSTEEEPSNAGGWWPSLIQTLLLKRGWLFVSIHPAKQTKNKLPLAERINFCCSLSRYQRLLAYWYSQPMFKITSSDEKSEHNSNRLIDWLIDLIAWRGQTFSYRLCTTPCWPQNANISVGLTSPNTPYVYLNNYIINKNHYRS